MKRRSFLRTVVGVLLAPLGLLGTVRVTEPDLVTVIFPDGTTLSDYSSKCLHYHFCCDGGRVVDRLGREWAKWRPQERLT